MDDKRIGNAIYNTWQAIGSDVIELCGRPTTADKVQFILDNIDTYGGDTEATKYLRDLSGNKADKLAAKHANKL